jgi:hypothetical protein
MNSYKSNSQGLGVKMPLQWTPEKVSIQEKDKVVPVLNLLNIML